MVLQLDIFFNIQDKIKNKKSDEDIETTFVIFAPVLYCICIFFSNLKRKIAIHAFA